MQESRINKYETKKMVKVKGVQRIYKNKPHTFTAFLSSLLKVQHQFQSDMIIVEQLKC